MKKCLCWLDGLLSECGAKEFICSWNWIHWIEYVLETCCSKCQTWTRVCENTTDVLQYVRCTNMCLWVSHTFKQQYKIFNINELNAKEKSRLCCFGRYLSLAKLSSEALLEQVKWRFPLKIELLFAKQFGFLIDPVGKVKSSRCRATRAECAGRLDSVIAHTFVCLSNEI